MHDSASRVLDTNLSQLRPALREAIRSTTAAVRTGPDGRPSVETPDGRWVPIHASDDPLGASQAAVARLVSNGAPPLVVTIGLGLGYLLDALERANETTRVLAIEPVAATTRAMLARRDWTRWLQSGRLTLLVGPAYAGSAEAWRAFKTGEPANPPTIVSPLVEREFPEEARRAKVLVGQIVAGVRSNEEARRQFAGRYLINSLRNLPAIATEGDVASLKGAFTGAPAIVVGAGPSLDRNLAMVKALEGRALVIAVDTALRPLLAAGVRPHIVAAVDPSELNARHLHDLPDMRGVWFVAEGSLDPSVLPPFAGQTFMFHVSKHEPWPWLAELGIRRGALRAWGLVLTTAFDLACEAGCDPIVFAGADLAYPGGLQDCRNTTYEPLWRDCPTDDARAERFKTYLAERPHVAHPDVHGIDVLTAPHYVQFRDWIVSRAAEVADRHVLNATGGGILHGGSIQQIDTSELMLTNLGEDVDLRQCLAAAWSRGATARTERLGDLDKALAERASLPMDAWLRFGGDTASAERITEVLDETAREVHAKAEVAAHLARERSRYDRGASTEQQARALIHPDYEFARVQAQAQQAHVLLDLMQRTYPHLAGASALDSVQSAATPPARLRVLDFGCGLGRGMEPLVDAGFRVDGIDMSAGMLAVARRNPKLAASQFFLGGGRDCGEAPFGAYDLVSSLHAFHRIRPRSIRQAVLRAIARALKPGGVVSIQVPFSPDERATKVPRPNVPWSSDVIDDHPSETRPGEVWATPDELPRIFEDFSREFLDLRFQFVDFPSETTRFGSTSTRRLCHLIISGSTGHGLAERMYGSLGNRVS